MKKYIILVFVSLFLSGQLFSQQVHEKPKEYWFVYLEGGMQMSGIKSEDFISSNIAPLFSAGFGRWFSDEIALRVGHKGFYFFTISDDVRHKYNFIYGDVLLNLNQIIKKKRYWNDWSFILHPGAGYFYNRTYERPNICGTVGIMNKINLAKHINVYWDIDFVIGWDIYQGDEDILPGTAFGIVYSFNK